MRSATVLERTLLSPDEAAAYLGLSNKTIRRWIADGRLPATRYGRKIIRIDQRDLDRLGEATPSRRAAGGAA